MKVYHKTIKVTTDDLDDLNHVNNVRYLQWVQDISKEHWQTSASKEVQNNHMWVVSTHYIEYKSAAVLNDVIKVKTYIKKSEGAISVRIVEMRNAATNKFILKAKTEWCLLNSKSFRPIRVSEEIKNIFIE
ncbi:acyl-CoA thioesterase [Cellulophaga omnivescoria]|uniref:acyl-CoA thioesterase n=1 Tax=Cellulophaga omnivescoria TaxID=1888890 RepID=UPI0009844242|nr:acyl-ACP thioesterase domain-containing protein [Cellulophaga omnivescoria]WBU88841.1 thioesterase [Cellulophaga omnivescoria]